MGMKRPTLLLVLSSLFLPAAQAGTVSMESLRSNAGLALPVAAVSVQAPQSTFVASRYVNLSGYISLRGNTHIREGSQFVSMTISGNATLHGSGARTDNVWVNERITFHLRDGQRFVNESVRISKYVSVYEGGRYVGSTTVSGTVRVSGSVSGRWLRLSGSGNLSGSIFVRDQQQNAVLR